MECAESVALLSEYREGTLGETVLVQVRAHLKVCPPCMDVYLDLETIVIAASHLREEQTIPFPDETVIWRRIGLGRRPIY
jgi:hypothetical protein